VFATPLRLEPRTDRTPLVLLLLGHPLPPTGGDCGRAPEGQQSTCDRGVALPNGTAETSLGTPPWCQRLRPDLSNRSRQQEALGQLSGTPCGPAWRAGPSPSSDRTLVGNGLGLAWRGSRLPQSRGWAAHGVVRVPERSKRRLRAFRRSLCGKGRSGVADCLQIAPRCVSSKCTANHRKGTAASGPRLGSTEMAFCNQSGAAAQRPYLALAEPPSPTISSLCVASANVKGIILNKQLLRSYRQRVRPWQPRDRPRGPGAGE
jgi:hypothetical protein